MATQPLPEFDPIRRRLQNQFTRQRQTAGDALTRRFASQGMLNSGAFAKMQADQERELGQAEADAMGQVDFQEAQEAQRRREIAEGRTYQTSERLGSQEFSKGMFDKQHGLAEKQFDLQEKQFGFQKDQTLLENEEARKNNIMTWASNNDIDINDPEEMNEFMASLGRLGYNTGGWQPLPIPNRETTGSWLGRIFR
jgi:hypothetical protein